MRGLRAAVGFLTRVPMGAVDGSSMGRAIAWFPIVGLLIGAASGGVYAGMWHAATPLVAAAIALAVELLITGAFHHDGLADMADGFGGGWTPERRLEIMKDSRHGTYGVVSLIAVLLIQFAALSSLGAAAGFAACVAANGLGRAAAVAVMASVRPARATGLGVDYRAGLQHGPAAVGVVVAIGAVMALSGVGAGAVLVGVAALGAVAVTTLSIRKIGGLAGDVLGAVQQVCASLVLVAATVIARHWPG